MFGECQSPDDPTPEEEGDRLPKPNDMSLPREELEEALREKEQFRTMAQRAQADLINYKRRATEEMEELKRTANSQLLLNILSVVDDLDRAVSLLPENSVASGWVEGLQLVQRNINQILEAEGISKIDAVGRPFEPWEFEAVAYQESADVEEGKVIDVLRDGYKHHEKVLRAAQVIVAKKPVQRVESENAE